MFDKSIEETAAEIVVDLLPEKSKKIQKIYEKCFKEFCDWCLMKEVDEIHRESVLLVYFAEKAKHFKASTLWSHYSMIKASFGVKNNIDISKYSRLLAFLKRQNVGYQPKKSKILAKEQIDRFLKEAPDEMFLMAKLAMIMGIAGALRSDELVKLSIHDIQDLGSTILVSVNNTKNHVNRAFTIISKENCSIDFVAICKKYMALRKEKTEHTRFFVGYRNNKCSTQPVGKNTFGGLPKQIAKYLKLPDSTSYTGHCFRRSSTSLLADTGADISVIKRHGGWKSSNVAEGYVVNSLANKKMIAENILIGKDSEKENQPSSFSGSNQIDIGISNNKIHQLTSLFSISGGSNINVNINIK